MDNFEPTAFGPLGGILTLVLLFILRELASGVLKEAGKDLWGWARRRHRRNLVAGNEANNSAGTGEGEKRGYAAPFPQAAHEIDAFWEDAFAATGRPYRAPTIRTLDAPIATACGRAGPEHLAFYCPPEDAIYLSPAGLQERCRHIGDFAPIGVLAHEWGHHIQRLLSIAPGQGNAFELQADCLVGAYARDAARRGLLDPHDITEAVALSATARDPLGLPQDAPGAHGINDDRITAFARGYLGDVDACALP